MWFGSDRYSATASALNSAEYAFIAISDISSSGSSRSSVHDVLTSGGTPECLNRNYWPTLLEARVVIEDFKDDHNHRHRHSALGYRTPAEYAAGCTHRHQPVACEID
ncbi:integrase core domain-containing protein [Rhodococcus aetherivorans]|uniref:integrase core domain-containing protein n=1 Tax=Rhodococcus aetherivorans TaxID=191292 RepID=UPI003B82E371